MFNLFKRGTKKEIQQEIEAFSTRTPLQKPKGYILTCDEIGYSKKNLAFRSFSVKTIAQLEKLEKELKSQFKYENFKVEVVR